MNIIKITYKNIDAVNPIQHSMEVHGKKFTRLIARDSE
jgi:hypothetical protein